MFCLRPKPNGICFQFKRWKSTSHSKILQMFWVFISNIFRSVLLEARSVRTCPGYSTLRICSRIPFPSKAATIFLCLKRCKMFWNICKKDYTYAYQSIHLKFHGFKKYLDETIFAKTFFLLKWITICIHMFQIILKSIFSKKSVKKTWIIFSDFFLS